MGCFSIVLTSCHSEHNQEHEEIKEEAVKIQLIAYSQEFELFAEADPFVVGKTSNVLSHLTFLSDFKAIDTGSVKLRLIIGQSEENQTLEHPTRKGIFSFDIKPKTQGTGQIIYEITTRNKFFQIKIPDVIVYPDMESAISAAKQNVPSRTNTAVFTKEQSWKIEFRTENPIIQPFGQVIKTTAKVEPSQNDEVVLSAKTNGMVLFTGLNILEGRSINTGEMLFKITGSGLADNNSTVRFLEAKNNYDNLKADYKRKSELIEDKIISEKEFLKSKTDFENAKAIYDNLMVNFSSTGQSVISPIDGYVVKLLVRNGQYVETGQPLVSVSKNKVLLLHADVQQKFAAILGSIRSANIRTLHDNKTYTLEELNGKVLSIGQNANEDNYLIPLNLQIDNHVGIVVGGFVELYLKAISNSSAVTIPNTSILEEQGNYFAFLQITPELFEKRQIMIGVSDGIRTEVTDGITQNDRIVSQGAIIIKLSQAAGTLDAHAGHVH